MSGMREAMQDVKRALGKLGQQAPEEMKCFSRFMETVLKPGKLDLKTKELIALATALTVRYKYCIALHTEKALNTGTSEKEIWEAATVSIMMGGGPALTYVAELHKALQEFNKSE